MIDDSFTETEPEAPIERGIDLIAEADKAALQRVKARMAAKLPEKLKALVPKGLTLSEELDWLSICADAGLCEPPSNPDTAVARKSVSKPVNLTAMERIKIGLSAGGLK